MCSKTCHLVNAPLITQVKTTALGALDPPLVAWFALATKIWHLVLLCSVGFFLFVDVVSRPYRMHLSGPKLSDATVDGVHLGDGREFKHDTTFWCLPLSHAVITWKLKHLGENTTAWITQSLILNSPGINIFLSRTRQSNSSASLNTFFFIHNPLDCIPSTAKHESDGTWLEPCWLSRPT